MCDLVIAGAVSLTEEAPLKQPGGLPSGLHPLYNLVMATWTFVRHGQSVGNVEGWFAGWVDPPLTALGEAQAQAASASLARLALERVLSSDLSRAHRTAEILVQGMQVAIEATKELRERSCGDWERRSIADTERTGDIRIFYEWEEGPPGGESLREVAQRAMTYLARVDDGRNTLVVAHGALMRAVIGVIDGKPKDQIGLWKPGNCELVTRALARGAWSRLLESIA
jgi:2,3-bisphosphoglycerate-dependent phosphoglycerate mutase/probable phosphoglycerate mutase